MGRGGRRYPPYAFTEDLERKTEALAAEHDAFAAEIGFITQK